MVLDPRRGYLAVATLLPIAGLGRLAQDSNLQANDILFGLGSDAALLLLMLAGYLIARRYCSDRSPVAQVNRYVHLFFSALALALLLAAELLYRRTGELLDMDIIKFAIANGSDIHGAVGSVLGWNDLTVAIGVVVVAAIMLNSASSRLINRLQGFLLVFPWGVLGVHVAFDAFAFDNSPIGVPVGSYQGRYANWKGDHEDWLSSHYVGARRGILLGIAGGQVFTRFELDMFEHRNSATPSSYSLPRHVSAPVAKNNVLVIVLESIRHDFVGAYQESGSKTSVTPFIDTLAKDGWLVERAYTTIPHTSKALVGIYCGTFPMFSPLISESRPGAFSFDCLPKLLASTGYSTGHFQTAPAEFEDRTGLLNNLGFETQLTQSSFSGQGWQQFGYIAMDDRAMVKPAVSWMQAQQQAGKPFLASVLTVLTHHPYMSPVSSEPALDPAGARDSYIKALGYTDKVVAELFSRMDKAGLLENTLVIVTGDHGEAFSEHGLITHNGVSFEEGMHVPLILWGKMLGPSRVIGGLRQHVDLMPTVLDLLGMKHDGRLPGISLLQADGHAKLITSCFYKDYCLNLYDDQGGKTTYFYGKRPPSHYELSSDVSEAEDKLKDSPPDFIKKRITEALTMKRDIERLFDAK